jgi:CheY-like chemotaxis protein
MGPDTLAKIFDPFFTTKFTGRGLGLSAVLGIVKNHRGALRIESQLGKGTTFVVLWPVAATPLVTVGAAPTTRARPGSGDGRTVLVIDDELTVATTIAAVLDELGFSSMIGVGGGNGLARFEANASEIECVIVDLTMPPPGGREVLRRLRELRPELPLVVMSGYAQDDLGDELTSPSATFIKKPFLAEDLQAAIQRVLSPTTVVA